MKFRRRRSLIARPRPALERTEPLRGQVWTRSERALREPDVSWRWRALAGVIAAIEIGVLGWLWFGPAMAVRTVVVTGAQHLTADQVARAAGLAGAGSVLSVDGESSRNRLLDQTWVRTATVVPLLPGMVEISIDEWQPVAVYHAGASAHLFYMSSQAVVLGPASPSPALVDVQGPSGKDPVAGDRPLDPELLAAMVNMQRAFPALLGQQVSGFVFDSCGDLTLVARRGWKVYFGRVLTPEEYSGLRDKLTALKAIAGSVNYGSSDLLYVNVMNPNEPAVGYRSRQAPPPSPSPGASPAPSPTPSPNPCR